MKCSQVIEILQQQAPEIYACSWDNVGLLIGSREREVNKIYLALDATDEVIKEAITIGADMLLTHHPLIFQGMKRITEDDFIGRRVIGLIRANICYYAMHTNFDVKGMGQIAAEKLGLQDTVPLEQTCLEDGVPQGIGRIGLLTSACSLQECCQLVKSAFGLEQVKVFGTLSQEVMRVAICPGAGKSDVQEALNAGADVYITGDIDHHTGIDAQACGMAIIDAGHYGIEHIFTAYMSAFLQKYAPQLEVVIQSRADPFQMI